MQQNPTKIKIPRANNLELGTCCALGCGVDCFKVAAIKFCLLSFRGAGLCKRSRSLAQSLRVLQGLGFVVFRSHLKLCWGEVSSQTVQLCGLRFERNLNMRLSISSCAKPEQDLDTTIWQNSWNVESLLSLGTLCWSLFQAGWQVHRLIPGRSLTQKVVMNIWWFESFSSSAKGHLCRLNFLRVNFGKTRAWKSERL